MKVSALTASAVALGLAVAVTACSSGAKTTAPGAGSPAGSSSASSASSGSSASSASSAGSSSAGAPVAASVPAGYRRAGGPAQGISIAVPRSWVTADLSRETAQRAAARIHLPGISEQQLIQTLESLRKLHALFVADAGSAAADPRHRQTNLNAYCLSSGTTESGSAGVPLLKQQAAEEFRQLNAGHIRQEDVQVGGVPGVQTSYTISTGLGTLQAAQLEVLPKPDRACFVTLTAGQGMFPGHVLPVAAETAVFY
jgi:hypothetical protein